MPIETSKPVAWRAILLCLGVVTALGWLDYVTGYQNSFFLFYLFPITYSLWRLGFRFAVVMCALSAIVWRISNLLAGETYEGWITPSWNTLIRFFVFLVITGLLAIRGRLQRQVHQSTSALSEEIQKRTRLEQEVLEATEREQCRIGHDLHDSLCQHLTATALAGKVLAKKLTAQSRPEAEAASHLVHMVEQGIEQTRTLARSLHPIELEAEGLVDGLRELAASISRAFSVSCNLECSQTVSLPTPAANMHLYRIAQEAISNAIRHGHAKNITLHLAAGDGEISLTIADDGLGLPVHRTGTGGMGLNIMQYRAGMIGGKLQVARLPSRGTQVACIIPETRDISSPFHAGQK